MIQNSPAYDPAQPCCPVCGSETDCQPPCVPHPHDLELLAAEAAERENTEDLLRHDLAEPQRVVVHRW